MDVLEKFLGGGAVASPPKPKSASVITDQLLDSLKKVESDKDPFALNKQSKAMGAYQFMPETVQMLHKQGIEFNPFNEKQAREAARTYLGQLVDRNNGDVDKALAQYGGFITKDPSGYVNKVKQGQAAAPTASTAPAAPAQTSADPLEAFLSGKPATAPAKPPVQPTAQPTQAVAQPAPAAADKATPSRIANIAAQTFNKYQDVKKDFGERVVGAIDTAYGIVPAIYGAGVQALARTAQTPEQAEKTGQAAAASIDRPIGKALGITGSEAYQKPLGGITEPIAEQVNKMFNVLGMTPEQISENLKAKFNLTLAPEDIRNMVVIGSAAIPQALREAAPVVGKVAEAAKQTKVGQQLTEAAKELEFVRPGQLSKAQAQAQFEAKKGAAGSAGLAAVESSSLKQDKANQLLIPMGDDYTKAQLTRNPADVRYESDTSKHPVYGVPFQEKYAIQNDKLRRNLQAEVDNTAAKFVGLPSADFGKTVISEPFQNYKNNRYQEVNNAYTAANQAGETAQPVSYKNITDFIESETKNRPTKKEQNSLYALVEEEIKANDPNKTGKISILQMEDIRKLINDEIDPQKKGSVRVGKKLKDNIDKATENAGGDFYKKARELNTKFNNDFEDIAVIRDINRNKKGLSDRVIPYEQLADRLVFKGPGSDLKSVLETFEKMGPEGQKIIQELRGYTADKIMQDATKNVQLDVNNKPYVSTAALNKVISELEKNGKLEMLFGKKSAERYLTLKDVTKELQTVPKDTTNPSGTAASIAAMFVESGLQFGVSGIPAPLVTGAVMLKNKMDAKKQLKKAEEYANPKTKISEMIK